MTSRSYDSRTGAEFDGPSLSTPCDQYGTHTQGLSYQQPASSYDYMTGAELDGHSLSTPCDQDSSHDQRVSLQQPTQCYAQSCTNELYAQQRLTNQVPYQHYQYQPNQPYNTYSAQYAQLYATQHTAPSVTHDENIVCVSDGLSWKEYNLENVFSW